MFGCWTRPCDAELSDRTLSELSQASAPTTGLTRDQNAFPKTRYQPDTLLKLEKLQEAREAYAAIAQDLEDLRTRSDIPEVVRERMLGEIGTFFWKRAEAAEAAGDRDRKTGDARVTVLALRSTLAKAQAGQIPVRDVRDELEMLARAYMMLNEPSSALDVYTLVFSSDRHDAEAAIGKAKAAEALKRDDWALEGWMQAQMVLTPRDPRWFEARYKIAQINADRGRVSDACNLLTRTEIDHPGLGSSEIKTKWVSLQHRLVCP